MPDPRLGDVDAASPRPRPRPGLARVRVDDHLLVGHERIAGLWVLNPWETAAFLWLDRSIDDFEFSAATASVPRRGEWLDRLIDAWTAARLLDVPVADVPVPRRWFVPPGSCRSEAIGLTRATFAQIASPANSFRVGATVPRLVTSAVAGMETESVDEQYLDAFLARVSETRRTRRLQQLFGPSGELLWFGDDIELASEALRRTAIGRARVATGETWLSGLTLERDGVAVIVGPVDDVIRERGALRSAGIAAVPAGLMRLDLDGTVTLPTGPLEDIEERRLRLAGFLAPASIGGSSTAKARMLAEYAWTWDQRHLDAVAAVAPDATLQALSPGQSVAVLVDGMLST